MILHFASVGVRRIEKPPTLLPRETISILRLPSKFWRRRRDLKSLLEAFVQREMRELSLNNEWHK